MRLFVLPLIGFCLLLAACAPFAPQTRQPRPEGLPASYTGSLHETAPADQDALWWKELGSPELDALMTRAFADSFDIAVARARLMQAEADARKAGAALYPGLNLSGDLAHQRRAESSGTGRAGESYGLGLVASYELDLWGRVRSEREAAALRHAASREDLASASMSLAGNLADTWAALLGVRGELAVLESQIATNDELVRILLTRYANAQSSGLDVLQQQELLLAAQAERPSLQLQIENLSHSLDVLCGGFPGATRLEGAQSLTLPPPPDPGLPADLLFARPDIRSAWYSLGSAEFQSAAAQANRLPALRLSARGAVESADRSTLFSNWLTNLAASLSAPLFDGGALAADADRAKAVIDEKVALYGKSVATAMQDVEDALSAELRRREILDRLEAQLVLARQAQIEARNSYLGGRDSFLRYITQLQNVQSLERRVVRERSALVRSRIALYRALGGRWTHTVSTAPDMPPPATNASERP